MHCTVIGDMNNNGFNICSLLNKLGVESTLILYEDDWRGGLSHFEIDTSTGLTGSVEILRTRFQNGPISSGSKIGASLDLARLSVFRFLKGRTGRPRVPRRADVIDLLGSRNSIVIGSGIAPALMNSAGLKLDVFFPYSTGVEFVDWDYYAVRASQPILRRPIAVGSVRERQIAGIEASKAVFSAFPARRFLSHLQFVPALLPVPVRAWSGHADGPGGTERRDPSTKLKFLSFGRLLWRRPKHISSEDWLLISKRNDLAFRALAPFLRGSSATLSIVEYGPDVSSTHSLINELGIAENTRFIRPLSHAAIGDLVAEHDVVIGQFYDESAGAPLWGGVGWEALAAGTLLVNNFGFNKDEFEEKFRVPQPPILKANSSEDLEDVFEWIFSNRRSVRELGVAARSWSVEHQGTRMMERWLDLLGGL